MARKSRGLPAQPLIYSYPAPNWNLNNHYVYLTSLGAPYSPEDFQNAGATAAAALDAGMSELWGAKDKLSNPERKSGLILLEQAIHNERANEIALVNNLQSDLGFLPQANLSDDPGEFYKQFITVLNTLVMQEKKINTAIQHKKIGEEEKAERRTQRFYEYLESEVYRAISNPKFQDAQLDEFINQFIAAIDAGKNPPRTQLEQAILNASVKIFNDADIQTRLLKLFDEDTEEGQELATQILKISQGPTGLKNIDIAAHGAVQNAEQVILKKREGKKIKTSKKGIIHKDTKALVTKVFGLGMEIYGVITQFLVGKFDKILSTGASQRKTDILSFVGTITTDASGIVEKLYDEYHFNLTEINKVENNMYEFSKKLQEAYKEANDRLNGASKKSFIIHTSAKDYLQATLQGANSKGEFGGFKGGGGMNTRVLAKFLEGIGLQNADFLIFALNNLPTESYGVGNKQVLSFFLSQFVGAFLFDDGLTIYSQELRGQITNLHVIHLFLLQGTYYPLSYILSLLYQELNKATLDENAIKGVVSVSIASPGKYGSYLKTLQSKGEQRWKDTAAMTMEKTSITMKFLKDFNRFMVDWNI